MSQLLLNWLNDEVQLSKKVTSFEKDFSNGYLFGELLSKFNQQLNFDEFQDKELRSSKIKNFQLLQQTFKTLNIKFNTQNVDGVIKEQTGVALQILYQLKMQLEKVNDPYDVMMHAKTGKYNAIVPLKRIKQPKEQFDFMETEFFAEKLNERNKAQKLVNLDSHLEKFSRFAMVQAEKERRLKVKEETEERNLKEEMRKIQLNKLQRNMAFMEDWNQKGIENWKKNQTIRHKNRVADEKFKGTMQKLHDDRIQSQQELVVEEMTMEIQQFEHRTPQEPVSLALRNKMMSEFLRKERDKRRRKMIVDQEKQTDELSRREWQVLEKLKQQSKQEKEIMYEIWRAYQCKEVITQNRLLRDECYRNKQELNVINQKFKEEEMLRTLQKEFVEEVDLQQKRQLEINVEYKLQLRQANYEKCRKLVEILFEIEEQTYEHLQNNDCKEIKQQFLRENNKLFIEGNSLIPYKRFRTFDPIPQIKLQETLNQEQKLFLAQQEMQDYIEGKGQWEFKQQNNFILGNIIRSLIESQFEGESAQQPTITQIPYVPLKCAIIGYAFSGKRSITEILQKKYGIQFLSIETIINELINYLQKYQSVQEHSQIWDESQLDLGRSIQSYLLKGQNIPDTLYMEAITQKIKRTFEFQNEDQIYEEYIKASLSVHSKQKRLDDTQTEEGLNWEDARKTSMVNTKPYCKGWVLYDFPHNYDEAKLLEKYLSGIEPQDQPSQLQARLAQAAKVVKPTPYEVVPRKKQQSGVGVCIYLQMPSNELSLKRAIGRRYDYHTHSLYHLDSNTPPVDNAPLVERIRPLYEIDNLQQQISDKNAYFMTKINEIQGWYDNFESSVEIEEVVEIEVEQNKQLGEDLGVDQDQEEQGEQGEQGELQQQQQQQEQQEQQQNQNLEQENLESQIVKQQVKKVIKLIQPAFAVVDATANVEKVFSEVDQIIQRQLEIESQIIKQKQENKLKAIQDEENKKKLLEEQGEQEKKYVLKQVQLEALPQKAPSKQLFSYLHNFWNTLEQKYTSSLEGVFRGVREQREFVVNFLMDIQKKFIDSILCPDEKFALVRNYQEQYNSFVAENPDLCEEDVCKEELHQRVDDLYDQLIDLIDLKRDTLSGEKERIQQSQFIETEIDLYLLQVRNHIQAEIDRSLNSIQLLNDYYCPQEGMELADIPQVNSDLNVMDGDDSQVKLDKLIADANRIFAGEEEVVQDDKTKKGAKPQKKDEKKSKKGKEVEEVKKELSNPEAIQAIQLEKSIFKDRIEAIREVAQSTIRQFKGAAEQVYGKLDDWIFYTHSTEIKALDAICGLFRQYIEREEKIQKEIQLNFVDVVISHEVLNFLTPIPPPLSAREPQSKSRYSISQLYYLIEDLRSITSTHLSIEIKQLALLLSRSTYGVLELSPAQWMKALKILDNDGYVQVREICTYLILLTSPTPSEQDLLNYKQYFTKSVVTKDEFIQAQAWFDEYEKVGEEENTNYFDRIVYIKELLFFVHKDENEQIGVKQYLSILDVQGERYIDFLLQNLN